jgi:Protein of unknown function (DUF2786)
MDRDSAIDKIKKCLNLAKSANQNEAATALRQAQALMREHGLDEEGVDLASVQENDVRAKFMPILAWEADLAMTVADAFGCKVIDTYRRDGWASLRAKRLRYWRFVGVTAAPEIAGYTFEVLGGQCVRERRAHVGRQSKNCKPATRTARGDAFAMGWVIGVRALVERFAGGETNANLLTAYMAKNYPSLDSAKVKHRDLGRNVKDDAQLGRQAAKRATLHHDVGSPIERKLIGALS